MKRLTILFAVAAPLMAQQPFDFKSLDKLDSLTSNKTKVTLDENMLGLAAGFLGGMDGKADNHPDSIASMVKGLKGVYVRSWEFDKDGQYSASDVEPFRAYLKQLQWSKIVESQEGKDLSEVYIQPAANGRFGGVAILDIEPRELTVVYINGDISLSDLQRLQGNMGIPGIDFRGNRLRDATPPPPASKKKDEKGDDQDIR
jgi:hypothetical protein